MRFALEQFRDVLKVRDMHGQPYILIGGQAVNFWAGRYVVEESALESARPFTSTDIDFLGRRNDASHIAAQLGLPARFPPAVAMTALAGMIPLRIAGETTAIEIVRAVPAVRTGDASTLAVEHDHEGCLIRVLDPISLLCCKTELALTLPQDSRRDVVHLRIMVLCTRAFLRETLRGVSTGELPVRGWLGAIERVLKLAESRRGRQAARKFDLDWAAALPGAEIAVSEAPKVVRFRSGRLVEWRRKLTAAG